MKKVSLIFLILCFSLNIIPCAKKSSDDDTTTSTDTTELTVTAGYSHTCALLDSASVKAGPYNNHGQLGIENTTNMEDTQEEMAVLPSIDLQQMLE